MNNTGAGGAGYEVCDMGYACVLRNFDACWRVGRRWVVCRIGRRCGRRNVCQNAAQACWSAGGRQKACLHLLKEPCVCFRMVEKYSV